MIRILMMTLLLVFSVGGCQRVSTEMPQVKASADGLAVIGQRGTWVQGKDYQLISNQQITKPAETVRVVEFFWYECPHCYVLESHLVLWGRRSRPKYVEFERVPATWRKMQQAHARLYYTLMELGREDLHHEVFDTIHRLGNPLYDQDEKLAYQQQLKFAVEHGVRPEEFSAAYNSPAVDSALKRAAEMAARLHLQSVPTVVVNDQYATTLNETKGNEVFLLDIVNALAARGRDAAGKVVQTRGQIAPLVAVGSP